mmetsp:Transcript_17542/g.28563  ORF Transcript_17542/g.28563 Transcript_17542/m.28563 type:complete len:240 (-) Transcript_17542:198-917(-)
MSGLEDVLALKHRCKLLRASETQMRNERQALQREILELEKDFQLHKKRKNQKYNAGNKGVDAVSEIKGGVGGETLMAAATSHNSAAENTDLLALANDTQRSFIKTATLSPARPNGDPINNCDGEMKESDDRKILKKRILQLEMDLQRYKARIDEQKKALGPNDLPQIPWEVEGITRSMRKPNDLNASTLDESEILMRSKIFTPRERVFSTCKRKSAKGEKAVKESCCWLCSPLGGYGGL